MDPFRLTAIMQGRRDDGGFAAALSESDWAALVPHLEARALTPGELLIRRGDRDRTAYFIEAGELEIFVVGGPPGSHRIARLQPGMLVGEPGLFGPGVRMAHVEAVTPAVVWGLRAERLEQLAEQTPRLALAVLRGAGAVLAARMRATLERGIPLS